MSLTAVAAMEAQSNNQLRYAMDRLFHKLRRYVRVHGRTPDDRMPEHDIVWETHIGHGPETVILDAIKMSPELWAGALPAECCIVHRETLKKYVGADAAEYMEGYGANAVAHHAARLRYEAEQRDLRKRYET